MGGIPFDVGAARELLETNGPEDFLDRIANLDHLECARLQRYAPSGHPCFDMRYMELVEAFKDRFYNHFGGMTPEISKAI